MKTFSQFLKSLFLSIRPIVPVQEMKLALSSILAGESQQNKTKQKPNNEKLDQQQNRGVSRRSHCHSWLLRICAGFACFGCSRRSSRYNDQRRGCSRSLGDRHFRRCDGRARNQEVRFCGQVIAFHRLRVLVVYACLAWGVIPLASLNAAVDTELSVLKEIRTELQAQSVDLETLKSETVLLSGQIDSDLTLNLQEIYNSFFIIHVVTFLFLLLFLGLVPNLR